MKGRYLGLATALAFFGYLNSANANIPAIKSNEKELEIDYSEKSGTIENLTDIVLPKALESTIPELLGTKWHYLGKYVVGKKLYFDLNDFLGGKVEAAESSSPNFDVKNGIIDHKLDKFDTTPEGLRTIIEIRYLKDGKKGRAIFTCHIAEK
ncbi:MAG: hypothetical protein Q7J54_05265 [Candidatus Woesearchaeota archaeon]|nr:hypothetical protein [Candidatus Woesearchaeota archaeon]